MAVDKPKKRVKKVVPTDTLIFKELKKMNKLLGEMRDIQDNQWREIRPQ